jgi:predicted nucleic acid-binding protein
MKDSARILVDTSIWIDFFRRKEPAYTKVVQLIDEDRICCAGIILSELMQGANSEKELNVLKDFLHVYAFINETPETWKKTGELSFRLRKRGKETPLSDCLISVLSLEADASIYTYDKHFKIIQAFENISLISV